VKFSKGKARFKVSADGKGIVSHAGTALLRELAAETGLVKGWTAALADTYSLLPTHAPGQVLVDLAVSIADGGDALRHLRTLRDQAKLFGPVASDPTAWRVVDKVDAVRLDLLQTARATARARAWAAGAGPDLTEELWFHFDASLLTAHSDKENAAPTWKKGFGFQCAMRRSGVSPGQPGGTWKEVPGPNDLPDPETVTGTRACQETGGHAETLRMARQEARVTWRKLDCLNPNLQRRQRRLHRHGV
jgi:hypothetical protein